MQIDGFALLLGIMVIMGGVGFYVVQEGKGR